MDRGSQKRILIVSSMSSGSSFLGELISSAGGVFYFYEPLHYVATHQHQVMESKLEFINSIFDCHLTKDYLHHVSKPSGEDVQGIDMFVFRNWRLWAACQHDIHLCYQPDFASKICSLFPHRLAKVVRLSVSELETYLNQEPSPQLKNWKIIYLVRDPRGVLSSRLNMTFCKNEPDACPDPKEFCQQKEDDLKRLEKLDVIYPGLFNVVKFEDLTANVYLETQKLFQFLEMPITRSVQTFLRTHTESDKEAHNQRATFRRTKEVASKWKKKLTQSEIDSITNSCRPLLKRLKLL